VNKSSTRVEALWNVDRSPSVSEPERRRLRTRLGRRIGADGVLRVAADDERSQTRNRALATKRLRALVERALRVPKPRKPTRPPRAATERRLTEKRQRGERKRERQVPDDE
jgi:ribosome-associated protein